MVDAKPYCAEHEANIQRIKRLEDDRRDHAGKLDKVTTDLTECVVEIREASVCLKSFVDKFSRINADCDAVSAHIEENRKRIDNLEKSFPDKLAEFESKLERKIEILFGVLASAVAAFELMIHFG